MKTITIISFIFLTTLLSGCLSSVHANDGYTDIIVSKKITDVSKEGSHYLLTTDKGMFEVDRPLLDTFNTTRNPDLIYSKIIEGEKYQLHHYGYRIDFIYEYPIVVDAEELK